VLAPGIPPPLALYAAEFAAREESMSTILIVEDDVFIHEYMEIIIQEIGHETLSARDMDGALSHLHALSKLICLFYRYLSQKGVLRWD